MQTQLQSAYADRYVYSIEKENKRPKFAEIDTQQQFVTSLFAAALLMKSTHRNVCVNTANIFWFQLYSIVPNQINFITL